MWEYCNEQLVAYTTYLLMRLHQQHSKLNSHYQFTTQPKLHCSTSTYKKKRGCAYHQATRIPFPYQKKPITFQSPSISRGETSNRPHVGIALILLTMVQKSLKVWAKLRTQQCWELVQHKECSSPGLQSLKAERSKVWAELVFSIWKKNMLYINICIKNRCIMICRSTYNIYNCILYIFMNFPLKVSQGQ